MRKNKIGKNILAGTVLFSVLLVSWLILFSGSVPTPKLDSGVFPVIRIRGIDGTTKTLSLLKLGLSVSISPLDTLQVGGTTIYDSNTGVEGNVTVESHAKPTITSGTPVSWEVGCNLIATIGNNVITQSNFVKTTGTGTPPADILFDTLNIGGRAIWNTVTSGNLVCNVNLTQGYMMILFKEDSIAKTKTFSSGNFAQFNITKVAAPNYEVTVASSTGTVAEVTSNSTYVPTTQNVISLQVLLDYASPLPSATVSVSPWPSYSYPPSSWVTKPSISLASLTGITDSSGQVTFGIISYLTGSFYGYYIDSSGSTSFGKLYSYYPAMDVTVNSPTINGGTQTLGLILNGYNGGTYYSSIYVYTTAYMLNRERSLSILRLEFTIR